jgi:hypothetical protein
MATVQFSALDFTFTKGEPKYFRSSSIAQRGFCGECGSPLVFVFDGDDEVWVLLGSLDHPEAWPLTSAAAWGPVVHTQIDSKIPWHVPEPSLPQWTSREAKFQERALIRLRHVEGS